MTELKKIFKICIPIIIVILAILIFNPMKIIDPTERAVKVTFGKVDTTTIIEPGIHGKIPFVQSFKVYDLTPNKATISIPLGERAAISSDKQSIGVNGEAIWRYKEEGISILATTYASSIKLHNDVDSIIITAVKNTIGKYDIGTIAKNQEIIATESQALAAKHLNDANIPVIITVLNLNNWDWTDDYDKMIKETVAMQQAGEKAKQELLMIEHTSQKQVKEATARADADAAAAEGRRRSAELDAEAKRLQAQGEADANRIRGQGIADYNRSIASNLGIEIQLRQLEIAKIEAESWDGRRVPQYIPLSPTGGVVTLPASPKN